MASWHVQQLRYAFGLGGLCSFYGIIFALTYYMPASTASYNTKILVVVAVLLTFPFALIMAYVVSRREKKKKKAEEDAAGAAGADGTAAAAAAPEKAAKAAPNAELSGGIEETVQFLKSSNLGEGGKDAIYSLPWYIVAGAPDSGKSSLVLSSNLNFQTLASQRQSEQKYIRPTGSVDYRVATEAVFLDTAGRYQNEGTDAEEWSSLIESLKKYRGSRPLDGLLLVVDTSKLLKSNESEIEEMAKNHRARLDDALQRLKVKFPIYLVFTNADSLEGFRDSFSASKNEGKSLVWGATIPLDKSENAQAMFDSEYELLHTALMKRRVLRLSAPFPPVRQLRIFNFPLHFGSARRKLGAFVSALFRPSPFSENPFFRGFYFVADPPAKIDNAMPQTVGNTYFSERFFRDVLLRDKDLVATAQAQRKSGPILGWLLTFLFGFIAAVFLILAGVSAYNNKQMLDAAKTKGERLLAATKTEEYKNPLKAGTTGQNRALQEEMNATEDLHTLLVQLDSYERDGAPWYMRFGLYSGNKIYKDYLLKIYMNVMEHRYKRATVQALEADLKKFSTSAKVINPASLAKEDEDYLNNYYDLLKAYLMLSAENKDKADGVFLAEKLKPYWTTETKLPPDLQAVASNQLEFWAKQCDREDEYFPRITVDATIVKDSRAKLEAFPPLFRYYKKIVGDVSKIVDSNLGQTTATSILNRNNGDSTLMGGDYVVPGAFTRAGLDRMKIAILQSNVDLNQADWVMGQQTKPTVSLTLDSSKLEETYYREYADRWKELVKSVTVKPYKNQSDAVTALSAFSGNLSPMRILLTEVKNNTNLSAKPEVMGWWDWLKSFVKSSATNTGGDTAPEKEFKALFAFVGAKNSKESTPIDKYQSEINNVQKRLSPMSDDKFKETANKFVSEDDKELRLKMAMTTLDGMLGSFKGTSASQEVATLLRKPLENLENLLAGTDVIQLNKGWSDDVLPAARELEKGYPFTAGGPKTDMSKLTAFLNPKDGKFSLFYDGKLKKYFEESGGKLKLKENAAIKDFTPDFIDYLNKMIAIRNGLFAAGPTPKLDYTFVLKAPAGTPIDGMIDGQKVQSDGTGSFTLSFPSSSTDSGVILNAGTGSSTPSTSSPPAPSGNSNSAGKSPSASSPGSIKYPGTWGLFEFVDASRPTKGADGEWTLTFNLGGNAITATIKASGADLFDKAIFKKAPDKMFNK